MTLKSVVTVLLHLRVSSMRDKDVIFHNFEQKATITKKRREGIKEAQLTLGQKLSRKLKPLLALSQLRKDIHDETI